MINDGAKEMGVAVDGTLDNAHYRDPEYQKTHLHLFSNSIVKELDPVLPPDISQEDFDKAVGELKDALGSSHVHLGKDLTQYIDPYELNEDSSQRRVPSAAVSPQTKEEVQDVLRIANKFKIPLWTFSRGKNLGYGGPAPRLSGSMALDLHRMNKIIEVNDKFAYAVVEPGVSFTDLYDYCEKNKLRVWPSVPSLGWGSVVGNTVDRGSGFLPTANHWQNIAGLEVLLADGDTVRTGQFGINDSPSAHLSKFTFGPSIEGLFLQSNLGIVTKMGLWLTPQPDAYMSCSFSMPEFEDVEVMIEIFRDLRIQQVIPNTIFVSSFVEFLSMFKRRIDVWDKPGPIPDSVLRDLQNEFGVGYWNAKFGLFGPRAVLQAQYDVIEKMIKSKAPTGVLRSQMFTGDGEELLDAKNIPEPHGGMFVGVPTLWSLPMVQYRLPKNTDEGKAGHIDFSSIIPSSGKEVLEWAKKSKQACESQGFELFCDFFVHERHVIFINFQTFDKTRVEHQKQIKALFADLYSEAKAKGYSNYRSHVNYMDSVADLYDFNNHAYKRFVEKLKGALDINGILSPGKQGIWPEKYREEYDAKSVFETQSAEEAGVQPRL